MMPRVSNLRAHAALAAILLFALVLRVVFFVGLVSGDPQDDGVYYGNALRLYGEGPRYLAQYRDLPADFLANPIDQFNVRPLVTYPIAASFALFGPGEVAATLWALVCSILSVFVIYRLGLALHGRAVGLIAALLCAFYPLEVINGTRILSDVQVGLCASIGLLCLVEATSRRAPFLYALAGVAAGAAYLANGRGLIVMLALGACAALQSFARKTAWTAALWVLAGFAAVWSVEALTYYAATGDPLLSYHIQSGASRYKYLHEPVTTLRWAWLEIRYTNGRPFELLASVLRPHAGLTNQFGWFFYVFFAAAVFALVRRRNLLLLGFAAGVFAYLEFGAVGVSLDRPHRALEYLMIYKQPRFLLMISAPLLVLAAFMLRELARVSGLVAVALVAALFVTSVTAFAHTRAYYRAGLSDLRAVTADVRDHPERVFFGDFWAVLHLRIFTRYEAQNLRVLDVGTRPDDVRNACVILGGSRGVELLADYVESTLPPFARDVLATGIAPDDWNLVKEIRGSRGPLRLHDLRLYCVAARDASGP